MHAYKTKHKKGRPRGERPSFWEGLSTMCWRNPQRIRMFYYATSVKLMRVTMPAKIAAGMTPTQMLPYLR